MYSSMSLCLAQSFSSGCKSVLGDNVINVIINLKFDAFSVVGVSKHSPIETPRALYFGMKHHPA